jgi:hypothetical protein
MAELHRKTWGTVVLHRCLLKAAGEFALSEFYATGLLTANRTLLVWAFHNSVRRSIRREEAREAQRGVWIRYNRD